MKFGLSFNCDRLSGHLNLNGYVITWNMRPLKFFFWQNLWRKTNTRIPQCISSS